MPTISPLSNHVHSRELFSSQVHVTPLPSHPRAIVFIPPLLQRLLARDVTARQEAGPSVRKECVCSRRRTHTHTGDGFVRSNATRRLRRHTKEIPQKRESRVLERNFGRWNIRPATTAFVPRCSTTVSALPPLGRRVCPVCYLE